MTKTVEFIFDFGSPNAYLAYPVLKRIVAESGATLTITPCLLGGILKATNNLPPMVAFAKVPSKLAYERLEIKRFIQRHDLTKFRMNPHFPVNTLLIMRGLVANGTDAYIQAVLAGMWERELKMDDPAIVRSVLDDAGLDGENILAATQNPDIKQKLAADTDAAVARGVFGIPTFFVGKDRLNLVAEELARDKSHD
jgi:2-hydroxychromene-2-carboxylate isomerase